MGTNKLLQFRTGDAPPGEELRVALGAERSLVVVPGDHGASLRVHAPSGRVEIEIEIALTADGPVVRTRAAALELNATGKIEARCAEFVVNASERIELRSGGELVQQVEGEARIDARSVDVQARTHGVRVKANDDVQLLGEHVLLNCDPPKSLPEWVPVVQPQTPTQTVAAEGASGDPALLAALGLKP